MSLVVVGFRVADQDKGRRHRDVWGSNCEGEDEATN